MSEYKQAFVSIAYKILRLMFQKKGIKRPNILMDGKIIILKEIQNVWVLQNTQYLERERSKKSALH